MTLGLDSPSSAALAAYLLERLEGAGEDAGRLSEHSHGEDGGSEAAAEGTSIAIASLLSHAHEVGEAATFMESLIALSRFCPTFEVKPEPDRAPRTIGLVRGADGAGLICLPSILATSSPYQYVKFAKTFRDVREVSVLPEPGFVRGELLPANLPVALEALADAIRQLPEGAPFVLVGHSSGGLLAYALAGHLEQVGVHPSAVVLLDTYPPDTAVVLDSQQAVIRRMLDGNGGGRGLDGNGGARGLDGNSSGAYLDDTRMLAMGRYFQLLADWRPVEIAAPTLLVRASEPMSGIAANNGWKASWSSAHTVVDVPGDHFTMMEEHADVTAQAVLQWLSVTEVR